MFDGYGTSPTKRQAPRKRQSPPTSLERAVQQDGQRRITDFMVAKKPRVSTSFETGDDLVVVTAEEALQASKGRDTPIVDASKREGAPKDPAPVIVAEPIDGSRALTSDFVRSYRVVKGLDEHRHLLVRLVRSARTEILLSSKSVVFQEEEVFHAFRAALDRGVNLLLYHHNGEKSHLNPAFDEFWEDCSEYPLRPLNIHAKSLIIDGSSDKGVAVIGSHNWLGREEEGDVSMVFEKNPAIARAIRGKTYQAVIVYEKIDSLIMNRHCDPARYESEERALREKMHSWNPAHIQLDEQTNLFYLTTLRQHEEFLKVVSRQSRERIKIYSPFFYPENFVARLKTLVQSVPQGVEIVLCVHKRHERVSKLFIRRTPELKDRRIVVRAKEYDFHRKTIKIDRQWRLEGSFNWLSAALSMDSEHHNLEASVAIERTGL